MSLPASADDGLTKVERRLALLIKKRNAIKPPKAKKNKPVLFDSLFSFFETFSTEEKCYEYIEAVRWGKKKTCPFCYSENITNYKKAYHYTCTNCKEIFSVKTDSIINEGKTSLQDWLTAIYLENAFNGGVTGGEIEKQLSLCKSTSTGIIQQIRRYGYNQLCFENFTDKNFRDSDSYIVDTTIRDGVDSQRHSYNRGQYGGRYKRHILVIVKQYGNARAFVTDGDTEDDVLPLIEQYIPEGSTICTNDEPAYHNLAAKGYNHVKVDHASRFFGEGELSTNAAANFISFFKSGLGKYRNSISTVYTHLYVNAAIFRFNTRNLNEKEKLDFVLKNLFTKFSDQDERSKNYKMANKQQMAKRRTLNKEKQLKAKLAREAKKNEAK